MTENQATSLCEKLMDQRAQLLEFAVQQSDADPKSWGWLPMLGDVQSAINALDEENGRALVMTNVKDGVPAGRGL